MKALKTLVSLVLALGTIQGLSSHTKRLDTMIANTNIVSVNDNNCSNMDAIISLYKRDNLLKHYDGKPVKVYVYHEYDGFGLSHNEIEINFTNYSVRYDL